MTSTSGDLRERLLNLVDPSPIPPDLFERVQSRARRMRAYRMAGAAASTAVVVVAALLVSASSGRSPRLNDTQLSSLIAASEAHAHRYHGPGIPADLRQTPLWVVGEHYSAPAHTVIVSYATDGHPCLGDINWTRAPIAGRPLSAGFQGGCSETDTLGEGYSYGPVGNTKGTWMGSEAYLYGPVPANVRVVGAQVKSGYLTERYAATIATPADTQERFVVFYAPGQTEHEVSADLTYYDVNGQVVGTSHVH